MSSILGLKGVDRISGFSGTVTGHSQTLGGSDMVMLTGPAKTGESPPSLWVEMGRVMITAECSELKARAAG